MVWQSKNETPCTNAPETKPIMITIFTLLRKQEKIHISESLKRNQSVSNFFVSVSALIVYVDRIVFSYHRYLFVKYLQTPVQGI